MTTIPPLAVAADARLQQLARRAGLQRRYFDLREYARARLERRDLSENARAGAIFVHVPKCAGTTITRQVPIAHWHRSAQYYRWRDPALFESAFTFGFVRNPFDRLVSAFHYLRSDGASARDAAWARRNLGEFADFPAFAAGLERRAVRDRVLGWLHFLPQSYFLCDHADRVLVDFVGRTERFSEGLDEINARTGLGLENQRHRAVARAPAARLYDAAATRLVADLYAADFGIFGYDRTPDASPDGADGGDDSPDNGGADD